MCELVKPNNSSALKLPIDSGSVPVMLVFWTLLPRATRTNTPTHTHTQTQAERQPQTATTDSSHIREPQTRASLSGKTPCPLAGDHNSRLVELQEGATPRSSQATATPQTLVAHTVVEALDPLATPSPKTETNNVQDAEGSPQRRRKRSSDAAHYKDVAVAKASHTHSLRQANRQAGID